MAICIKLVSKREEVKANNCALIQKKVLLFGQSAGAENVYIIGSLPQAPSLVNAIISESGGGRSLSSNSTQQKVGASFAQMLNCSSNDVGARDFKSRFIWWILTF